MVFQVGDRVMLKVLPWKGVVRFSKWGKLNPRYVRPFKVLAKVGAVAYKLELPQELSKVHNTFHVSNLKKCYAEEPVEIIDVLHIDDKLHFVKEPVEIMDPEVKRLKQSRIPIINGLLGCGEGVFHEEKKDKFGVDSINDDVVPKVEDVRLVDEVLEGAFGCKGDEDFAMGKGFDEEDWVDAIYDLRIEGKEEDDDEE
ncbi:hypothetical protein Tco_1525966 [Tanacetum coccineum]